MLKPPPPFGLYVHLFYCRCRHVGLVFHFTVDLGVWMIGLESESGTVFPSDVTDPM